MKSFEIVDLLPLHRQMTLVIFRNPDTQKCEVQILPVSLETTELRGLQEMLKIPAEPGAEAATVSVEVEESLSRDILSWCEERGITVSSQVKWAKFRQKVYQFWGRVFATKYTSGKG